MRTESDKKLRGIDTTEIMVTNKAMKMDSTKDKENKERNIKDNRKKEKETIKTKEKEGEHTKHRIGTWNVRSILGKEEEIVEEMITHHTEILGVTETKKKGRGMRRIHKGYWLYWSGVEEKERAV